MPVDQQRCSPNMHSKYAFDLRGIIPPLVTPLKGQDELDAAGLERLLAHVLKGGVNGIFILGTPGEGPSLSSRLKRQLIRAVCDQVAATVPVLVSISDTSIVESLELALFAKNAGAKAAVVAPPFYFSISQGDLLSYIEWLSSAVQLPLVLYNIPSLTKIAYEPETIRRAALLPGVIGAKDSSGDLGWLIEVSRLLAGQPDFEVMVGPEEILAKALRAGASGGVCGGANLLPSLFSELYQAATACDWERVDSLQNEIQVFSSKLYTVGDKNSSYLRGLKAALAQAGLCEALPALPLQPFSNEEQQIVRDRMNSLEVSTWTPAKTRTSLDVS